MAETANQWIDRLIAEARRRGFNVDLETPSGGDGYGRVPSSNGSAFSRIQMAPLRTTDDPNFESLRDRVQELDKQDEDLAAARAVAERRARMARIAGVPVVEADWLSDPETSPFTAKGLNRLGRSMRETVQSFQQVPGVVDQAIAERAPAQRYTGPGAFIGNTIIPAAQAAGDWIANNPEDAITGAAGLVMEATTLPSRKRYAEAQDKAAAESARRDFRRQRQIARTGLPVLDATTSPEQEQALTDAAGEGFWTATGSMFLPAEAAGLKGLVNAAGEALPRAGGRLARVKIRSQVDAQRALEGREPINSRSFDVQIANGKRSVGVDAKPVVRFTEEDQQRIFALKNEGKSQAEIAAAMGATRNSIAGFLGREARKEGVASATLAARRAGANAKRPEDLAALAGLGLTGGALAYGVFSPQEAQAQQTGPTQDGGYQYPRMDTEPTGRTLENGVEIYAFPEGYKYSDLTRLRLPMQAEKMDDGSSAVIETFEAKDGRQFRVVRDDQGATLGVIPFQPQMSVADAAQTYVSGGRPSRADRQIFDPVPIEGMEDASAAEEPLRNNPLAQYGAFAFGGLGAIAGGALGEKVLPAARQPLRRIALENMAVRSAEAQPFSFANIRRAELGLDPVPLDAPQYSGLSNALDSVQNRADRALIRSQPQDFERVGRIGGRLAGGAGGAYLGSKLAGGDDEESAAYGLGGAQFGAMLPVLEKGSRAFDVALRRRAVPADYRLVGEPLTFDERVRVAGGDPVDAPPGFRQTAYPDIPRVDVQGPPPPAFGFKRPPEREVPLVPDRRSVGEKARDIVFGDPGPAPEVDTRNIFEKARDLLLAGQPAPRNPPELSIPRPPETITPDPTGIDRTFLGQAEDAAIGKMRREQINDLANRVALDRIARMGGDADKAAPILSVEDALSPKVKLWVRDGMSQDSIVGNQIWTWRNYRDDLAAHYRSINRDDLARALPKSEIGFKLYVSRAANQAIESGAGRPPRTVRLDEPPAPIETTPAVGFAELKVASDFSNQPAFTVLRNPSVDQMDALAKTGPSGTAQGVRIGVDAEGNVYAWNANAGLHSTVEDALGVNLGATPERFRGEGVSDRISMNRALEEGVVRRRAGGQAPASAAPPANATPSIFSRVEFPQTAKAAIDEQLALQRPPGIPPRPGIPGIETRKNIPTYVKGRMTAKEWPEKPLTGEKRPLRFVPQELEAIAEEAANITGDPKLGPAYLRGQLNKAETARRIEAAVKSNPRVAARLRELFPHLPLSIAIGAGLGAGAGFLFSPVDAQASNGQGGNGNPLGGVMTGALAGALAPIWFSRTAKVIDEAKTVRAPAEQWWSTISKAPGVKREELDWMGLEDWLKSQPGPVSKQDVAEFVRANGVRVEETVKGGQQASLSIEDEQALLKAIERRDVLRRRTGEILRLPDWKVEASRDELDALSSEIKVLESQTIIPLEERRRELRNGAQTRWPGQTLPGGENYRELLLRLPSAADTAQDAMREKYGINWRRDAPANEVAQWDRQHSAEFRSSHWDEPNVLAHIRFKERTDADGKRTLAIEEVQSDWHQAGREGGYTHTGKYKDTDQLYNDLGGKGAVPNAPFKNNAWASLALKRMIRWAAENGFDQIAWVPGNVKNGKVYPDGRAQMLELSADGSMLKTDDGNYRIVDKPRGDNERTLSSVIGKTAADELLAAAPIGKGPLAGVRRLEGDFVLHNNQGWEFYDHVMPSVANDLGKKYGAKVGETRFGMGAPTKADLDARWARIAAGEDNVPHPGEAMQTMHALPITPAMKAAALNEGMPVFNFAPVAIGAGTAGAGAAAMQSREGQTFDRVR